MTIRVAVNGLGRIGRCVMRAIVELGYDDIVVVAANSRGPVDTHAHLLKYDSIHGTFPTARKIDDNTIDMGKGPIAVFREDDPSKLPWAKLGIDVVLECTGAFKTKAQAAGHLKAGAKKVLISAPADDPDVTVVYGVNNADVKKNHEVISVGSCTTNCLAPIAKVLNDAIGIERGFMTTIHSYTNDQVIADSTHKDLRRARAGALSLIPSSTGAAKALSLVIPELKGKLDGTSIRVPTPNVSLVDLKFDAKRPTTVDEIHQLINAAANGPLKGVLAVNTEPLVSVDFNHNPHSSVFDTTGTKVIDKTFVRVASWYDNEWGFSVRMLDVTRLVGKMI